MADDKPIIIVKKKGGHGGHHGGAWKVAYADFVTAMMAFFMVMWLVNSAETKTKKNIANYFRRPGIFESGSGTPLLIGESGILEDAAPPVGAEKGAKKPAEGDTIKMPKKSGSDDHHSKKQITYRGEQLNEEMQRLPDIAEQAGVKVDNPGETLQRVKTQEMLEQIAADIREQLASMPELSELLGVVDIKVGADGLNMEIMDTEKSSMFASGSAKINPEAEQAFAKITGILQKIPNKIEILGHTDAKPFASRARNYTNWELSADRANAARRLLEAGGISPDNITSVVGRAAKEPRLPDDPMSPSNRRITLKMKFDFSKRVDLSKDPAALEKIPEYEKEHQLKIERLKEEQAARLEEEKVHSMTTKEVLEKKDKGIIVLPQSTREKGEAITHSKDKIFGDSPVLGTRELIFGE